jgi:biopolymer transport protein ExbB
MQSFNLIDMWHAMGLIARVVVILLVLMSMYSLWVIVDRAVLFNRVKRLSLQFVLKLQKTLKAHDLDQALKLSKAAPQSPLAKVVEGALVEYEECRETLEAGEGHADFDIVELVTYAVDRVKEREIAALKKGLGPLASISSAAPFIGLFGTVVGIINAFQSMASSGAGGLGSVSKGISEALFTTAVGLSVAIPAVMAFNYFTNAIERFVVDFNDISSELISYVLRRGEHAVQKVWSGDAAEPEAPDGEVVRGEHAA